MCFGSRFLEEEVDGDGKECTVHALVQQYCLSRMVDGREGVLTCRGSVFKARLRRAGEHSLSQRQQEIASGTVRSKRLEPASAIFFWSKLKRPPNAIGAVYCIAAAQAPPVPLPSSRISDSSGMSREPMYGGRIWFVSKTASACKVLYVGRLRNTMHMPEINTCGEKSSQSNDGLSRVSTVGSGRSTTFRAKHFGWSSRLACQAHASFDFPAAKTSCSL